MDSTHGHISCILTASSKHSGSSGPGFTEEGHTRIVPGCLREGSTEGKDQYFWKSVRKFFLLKVERSSWVGVSNCAN